MKTKLGLADIIRPVQDEYLRENTLTYNQKKALLNIVACRTAELGGHIQECGNCKKLYMTYNSCRNANCPKCGGIKRIKWMLGRAEELPPVPWYHIVFTVPDVLNGLFIKYPKVMYGILFHSAWETIETFARDPKYLGARSGMLAVLHTWGQNMGLHPHLHCIVPGGGITVQNTWRGAKKTKSKFLFPVNAMGKVFRGIFTDKLKENA